MLNLEGEHSQVREQVINLQGMGILPFTLKDLDQDEMSFIIYELDDFPETQETVKQLFHTEVKYRINNKL
jgi:hypothetical protein